MGFFLVVSSLLSPLFALSPLLAPRLPVGLPLFSPLFSPLAPRWSLAPLALSPSPLAPRWSLAPLTPPLFSARWLPRISRQSRLGGHFHREFPCRQAS